MTSTKYAARDKHNAKSGVKAALRFQDLKAIICMQEFVVFFHQGSHLWEDLCH